MDVLICECRNRRLKNLSPYIFIYKVIIEIFIKAIKIALLKMFETYV